MIECKEVEELRKYEKITKCTCDRCGNDCEIKDRDSKFSFVRVTPQWCVDTSRCLHLCPDCTKELVSFFPKSDERINTEFVDDLEFYLKD